MEDSMDWNAKIRRNFEEIIKAAYKVSAELGKEAEQILKVDIEKLLSPDDAQRLLSMVINAVIRKAREELCQ
jgi:hypothetical protein